MPNWLSNWANSKLDIMLIKFVWWSHSLSFFLSIMTDSYWFSFQNYKLSLLSNTYEDTSV